MQGMRHLFGLTLGVLLSSFLMATAQDSSAPPQNGPRNAMIPQFRTQTSLVLVDVVVRDHGQPVRGLKADDFRLFEDGVSQKVSVFEEHKSTDTVETSRAPQHFPPDTYSDAQPYTIESAANVVLLDALNTSLSDQKYVRTRLLRYLNSIPQGARVAVFTLGSKLRIIEGFTTESSVIEKALTEKRGRPEPSPIMDPVLDQTMSDAADMASTLMMRGGMLEFAAETQSFEGQLRSQITLDALTQLATYLSTIPGRKNLLWVTGSLPFAVPLGSGRDTEGGSRTPAMNFAADFQDPVKKLAELLTVARVAVYPIDAEGLVGVPSTMAETNIMPSNLLNSVPGQLNDPVTFATRLQKQDRAVIYNLQASHGAMDLLAAATGGKAFYNTNGIADAVGDAIGIGSNYYTLAYSPENRNYNGAFRRVVVKTPEEHYELEYRPGYFATDPSQASKLIAGRLNPLIAAMQHGSLPVCQVSFTVRVIPAAEDPAVAQNAAANPKAGGMLSSALKRPVTRYVAEFSIVPAGVDYRGLPDGRRHREIELTQVLYDPEGIRINYNDFALGVDMPAGAENVDARIQVSQEIDVPAGQNYLRLGVSDLRSGRMGTVEIPLNVEP